MNKIRKHNFPNKYLCGALVLSSLFCLSGRQKFSFLLVYFICKKKQNTENFGFSGRKNWLPKLSRKHFGNTNSRPFWQGGLFSCCRPLGIRLVEYFKAKIVSRVTTRGLNWNYKLHTLKRSINLQMTKIHTERCPYTKYRSIMQNDENPNL